jgi:fructose-1,6-bisphosphatase I
LLYECNPLAFIVKTAGGMATNGIQDVLEVQPTSLHQRSPLFIGSYKMMEELKGCLEN